MSGMISLLGTPKNILGQTIIFNIIFYIALAFIITIFFLFLFSADKIIEDKNTETKSKVSDLLSIYIMVSVFMGAILTFSSISFSFYLNLYLLISFLVSLIVLGRIYTHGLWKFSNKRAYAKRFFKIHERINKCVNFIILLLKKEKNAIYLILFEVLILAPFITLSTSFSTYLYYYTIVIGIDGAALLILAWAIHNESNNNVKGLIYTIAFISLAFSMQYSFNGLQVLLPRASTTLNVRNVTDSLYIVSGLIPYNSIPTNSKTFTETIEINGQINFTLGLNYSYIQILNNTGLSRLGTFYKNNIDFDILKGILPPGTLVNSSLAPCSFSDVKCYQNFIDNNSYIIIEHNKNYTLNYANVMLLYNPNTNTPTLIRRLNYSVVTSKNCNELDCNLSLSFTPLISAGVLLQGLKVYLPYNYSNISISIPNQNCQGSKGSGYSAFIDCFNQTDNQNVIEYPNPYTNYINIQSQIIYKNQSLHINLNMTNLH